jgi:hypothetical protein
VSDDHYRDMVALGCEGLIPLVWLERVSQRCDDPMRPTRTELFPEQWEREAVVEVLTVADVLACGAPGVRGKPKGLAALAKGLVYLSLAPGGVKFAGLHVEAVEQPGGWLRLECCRLAPAEVAVMDVREAMRRAGLEGFEAAVFVCPTCGMRSHNPEDNRQGWCGRCNAQTGERR